MNTLKEQEKIVPEQLNVQSKRAKGRLSRYITGIISGKFLAREGLVSHLPFIAFLTALFLLHISITYFFESTERRKASISRQLQEASAGFNSITSRLEIKRQQSSITTAIKELGLKEIKTPPQFIDVKKGYFDLEDQK